VNVPSEPLAENAFRLPPCGGEPRRAALPSTVHDEIRNEENIPSVPRVSHKVSRVRGNGNAECVQQFPGCDVPQLDRVVAISGSESVPVRTEGDAINPSSGARERPHDLQPRDVIEFDRVVAAARCECLPVGTEGQAAEATRGIGKRTQRFAARNIP
jgi:hypothetical protein